MTALDLGLRYRVAGYEGIAWALLGYATVRDEDYEWTGLEFADTGRVRALMVGDDRVFTFDVDELTPLAEGEFCPECGQIGCTAGVAS